MSTHSYTRRQLSMEIDGSKYFLPFDADVQDDKIIEKTIQLFSDAPIYERRLYTDLVKKPSVFINEYAQIEMMGLYEGHDEYYSFSIVLDVFRLQDEKQLHDRKWMIAMIIQHEHGGLLDELLELRSIPLMVSALQLTEYSCLA